MLNRSGLDADALVPGAVIVGGPELVALVTQGAPSVDSTSRTTG